MSNTTLSVDNKRGHRESSFDKIHPNFDKSERSSDNNRQSERLIKPKVKISNYTVLEDVEEELKTSNIGIPYSYKM